MDVGVILSILLSLLLVLDKGWSLWRARKKAPNEDKKDDLTLLQEMGNVVAGAVGREAELSKKLEKLQTEHEELKALVQATEYDISFKFRAYPPRVSHLKVTKHTVVASPETNEASE